MNEELRDYLRGELEQADAIVNEYNNAVADRDRAVADREALLNECNRKVDEAENRVNNFGNVQTILEKIERLHRFLDEN